MFEEIYPVKVQELFAPYLYQHKKLTLPGIGTFDLNPSINIYEIKEESWPADAITFLPDVHARTDDAFLQYLVEQTGKMKILALSDLDSYLNNGIQLLNIGKPLQLKGIGMISKSSNGRLVFAQGQPVPEKGDVPDAHYILKDRTRLPEDAGGDIDFAATEKRSSRKPFVILASLLALALLAWAIYLAVPQKERNSLSEENSETPVVPITTISAKDTNATAVNTIDTLAPAPPAVAATQADSLTGFRMVIQKFAKETAANERLNVLKSRGHNVSLLVQDSSFQIVLQVNRPLQDTAYVRDSLQRWYRFSGKILQ